MARQGSNSPAAKSLADFMARQGILVAFVVSMVIFALASDRFLDVDNILGVVRSSTILGVMALGVTFVVISGNLDLSVGSMMSFSTIVVLDLHDRIGPELAILAMFAMTMAIGALIGFLVGYLRLNSLIVTLGMLSAIHGLTLTYSGGKNMDIADKQSTWFAFFGQDSILGIPVPILIFIALAAILAMLLGKTPFGRKVYAVGGNSVAATFSGIPRARTVFICYLISSFCVAVAGLIQASRSLGSQNTVGQGLELEVLAAIILGVMRAIGETMVVWMASGNAAKIPSPWFNYLEPIRTLTATIAGDMGEADHVTGSARYHVLFAMAFFLLLFAFIMNLVSEIIVRRARKRAGTL